MKRILLCTVIVAFCSQASAQRMDTISNMDLRRLVYSYFHLTALETCYLGSQRAIDRTELRLYAERVDEIERESLKRLPETDEVLLKIQTRRLYFGYYNRPADPAPFLCLLAITDINKIYEIYFPKTTRWPQCAWAFDGALAKCEAEQDAINTKRQAWIPPTLRR